MLFHYPHRPFVTGFRGKCGNSEDRHFISQFRGRATYLPLPRFFGPGLPGRKRAIHGTHALSPAATTVGILAARAFPPDLPPGVNN